uniref:Uncharacterized protein n=1 Tax=Heterorhabditis bacteriophora TaxID=37862 RepID=A0A1I7WLE6_HETBA
MSPVGLSFLVEAIIVLRHNKPTLDEVIVWNNTWRGCHHISVGPASENQVVPGERTALARALPRASNRSRRPSRLARPEFGRTLKPILAFAQLDLLHRSAAGLLIYHILSRLSPSYDMCSKNVSQYASGSFSAINLTATEMSRLIRVNYITLISSQSKIDESIH